MNQFNFSRFFKFFFNEWKMNAKQILLLWGALILSAAFYCIMNCSDIYGIDINTWIIWATLFLFCMAQGFYISIQLGAFTSKVRKTALLLQPVSKAEFFTAKMLSCFVLFPFLYIAFTALVALFISRYNLAHVDSSYLSGKTLDSYIQQIDNAAKYASIWWPCVTAVCWTGAFYFGRYAVVKSVLAALALYIGLTAFCYLLFGILSGGWDSMSFPLLAYDTRYNATWDVFYAWPGFLETFVRLGALGMVVMSVFKYHEKTV